MYNNNPYLPSIYPTSYNRRATGSPTKEFSAEDYLEQAQVPYATPYGGVAAGYGNLSYTLAARAAMLAMYQNQALAAVQSSTRAASMPIPQEEEPKKGFYWKTRICTKWQDGHCPFGDSCKYAHGEYELRVLPDEIIEQHETARLFRNPEGMETAQKKQIATNVRKTKLCQTYMETGQCPYGDKCTFAHGHHELRRIPMAAVTAKPNLTYRKTRLCERFMTTGNCPYGDNCTYAHGIHDLKGRGQKGAEDLRPAKRGLEEEGGEGVEVKRARPLAVEEAQDEVDPCGKCQALKAVTVNDVLEKLGQLPNPKAKQLGCIVVATAKNLGATWKKFSAGKLMQWMQKYDLPVLDRIHMLRILGFHSHDLEGSLDSNPHVLDLPRDIADLLYLCTHGKENTASATEYVAMIDACKELFGLEETDDEYFSVSEKLGSVMM